MGTSLGRAFPSSNSVDALDSPSLTLSNPVLTVPEVASELRCSRAHVHNLIAGKVQGVTPLPSLWLGRRRLVRRVSFDEWLRRNEKHAR